MHWQVSVLQYYWGLIPIPSLCMCVHEWKTWTQVQFVQEHDSRFIFYIVCIYIIWMCCCAHVWMILYALCIYVWRDITCVFCIQYVLIHSQCVFVCIYSVCLLVLVSVSYLCVSGHPRCTVELYVVSCGWICVVHSHTLSLSHAYINTHIQHMHAQ